MKSLVIRINFCIVALFYIEVYAQKFEWVKFFQGNSTQYICNMNADKHGNTYLSINFLNEIISETDTVKGNSNRQVYISKKDSTGNTLWYRTIKEDQSGSSLFCMGSTSNSKGNILVFLKATKDIISGQDTIRKKGNSDVVYLIEFNSSGQMVRGDALISGTITTSPSYIQKNFTNDDFDNIYISLAYNSNIVVYDTLGTYNITVSSESCIFKFSNSGKEFKWVKKFPRNIITNTLSIDISGNVYNAGFWENSPSSFTFKNQSINRPQSVSGCVFILDKNGNDKNWFHILASGGESTISGLAVHDSNSLYISGYFKGDSAKFDNTWKKSKSNYYYHFFACYQADGKMIWEKHQDTSRATSYSKHNDYGSVKNFKNQFFYISHSVYDRFDSISYDGQSYMGRQPYPNAYQYWGMNLKVDDKGNILWGFRTFYPFAAMGTDGYSNLYFGGYYENDSIFFGPYKSKGYQGDAFVGKTYDYAIFRGNVLKGPYCAGDTFKVPYTKQGEFGDSNVFYAELSDENGEFLGNQRILGYIQSKDSGTIIGQLPIFQVKSSPRYRIRIRSTSPQAQSFYKLDTLKLLIYSRDKANPGPDTIICKGDTIRLSTFGGTKWTWKPKSFMNDSNVREPLVWPLVSTIYQIIIADSSGCGETDTAYKVVNVRKDLSIKYMMPKDTSICLNGKMQIIVSFSGGDSLNYNWQWTTIDSKGIYGFPKSSSGKISDTLEYTISSSEKDSIRFIVFLSDNCMPKTVFNFYTLKVSKNKSTTLKQNLDTALCPGTSCNLIANFKGISSNYLTWQWQEKSVSNIWSLKKSGSGRNSDTFVYSLPLDWKGIKLIRVILKDNCSGLLDTTIYTIQTRDTIELKINTNDTTLCIGQSYTWKCLGKGGNKSTYNYLWIDTLTSDTLSRSDTLQVTAIKNLFIQVKLYDNCMSSSVIKGFRLNTFPALTLNLYQPSQDTNICYGHKIKLKSKGLGGRNINYSFKWILNNVDISQVDSFLFDSKNYFSDSGGTATLFNVLSDGCTVLNDTNSISIKILPKLNVSIKGSDSICYKNQEVLFAEARGGAGNYSFQWKDANENITGFTDTQLLHNNSQFGGSYFRKLILSDACPEKDTTSILVKLLLPLQIKISTLDSCPISTALLNTDLLGGKIENYQVFWFEENSFLGQGKTFIVNPNGPSKFYKAILKDNCSEVSDTARIELSNKPTIKINANGLCLGLKTNIKLEKSVKFNTLNYQWLINDQLNSINDSVLVTVFTQLGIQKIKVIASTNNNCKTSDSLNLVIYEIPKADFTFAHFDVGAQGIKLNFINNSKKSNFWKWYFGNGDSSMLKNPIYYYQDTGNSLVTLIASNQDKCFDTTSIKIPILRKIEFFFPNVFSPNENGINEQFGLNQLQIPFLIEFHIQIYNRWGEKVFESNNPFELWSNGTYQQGIYIYKAEIRDIYNVFHELKGIIEVLR